MRKGYEEKGITAEDVRYDEKLDGVWISDDVFLPRNVAVWAFQALASGEKK